MNGPALDVSPCDGQSAGRVKALEDQVIELCNELWSVHALLRATREQLTKFELEGEGEEQVGDDASDTLFRLLSLTMDKVHDLAANGGKPEART